jgi:mono/diheme cytochrome c family protein
MSSCPSRRWLRASLVALVCAWSSGHASHAADPDAATRGRYLFDAAGCGGCHGGDTPGSGPSGGLGLDTPFGRYNVPNITPDKTHGIGAWTNQQFRAALREGIGATGERLFPVFPYTSFTFMTDADIDDLHAYIMTLPPVPAANKPHEARAPFGWRFPLLFWRALFFTEGPMRPDPAHDADWNRGNYLVHAVSHCEECHSPRNLLGAVRHDRAFSGNIGGPDGQNAPNITSDKETGIGDWSVADIEYLLKTGMTPESDQVGSGMKAVVRGTSKLTDADRHAMAVYLKTVPPIHTAAPPPPKQ